MNRKWLLLPLGVVVVIALVWVAIGPEQRAAVTAAVGITAPPPAAPRAKPVCVSESVPVGDCIPQRLAHLPPDPGAAGKKTIEGIDSDKDGVRDDVQRFIFIEYGHSQRAVAALTAIAKYALWEVKTGDSISRDEAYERVKDNHVATCYMRSVDQKDIESNALSRVEEQITNTPERLEQSKKFHLRLAFRGFLMPDFEEPLEKLCGYDPTKLAN